MNNKFTFIGSIILLALILSACGSQTVQPTSQPDPATEAVTQPTNTPLPAPTNTLPPLPTDTSLPAPTDTPPAAAGTISFATDVMPIFKSRCIKCHGVESTKKGLDMTSFDNLMKGSENGAVVQPGKANDSLIVQKIAAGKMPKSGPKLTPAQLQTITDWINAGALNN